MVKPNPSPAIVPDKLLRCIEDEPRTKVIEETAALLKQGVTYRQFLSALFLATVRKSNSHHEAFKIISAHEVSLSLPMEERLYPLFWAMDSFKFFQERDPAPKVEPFSGPLPAPEDAEEELHRGVKDWDLARTEAALLSIARNDAPEQTIDRLWHIGARDWGFIGHKIIGVANSIRVLRVIGWEHAEPVLRFIARQLFIYSKDNVDKQCYYGNRERVDKNFDALPATWARSTSNEAATKELWSVMRSGDVDAACERACRMLLDGACQAGAVWDAVHVCASETILRFEADSGITGRPLHANTSNNAMHYAFRNCNRPKDRLLIVLQAVGWTAEAARALNAKGHLADRTFAPDQYAKDAATSAGESSEYIFSALDFNKDEHAMWGKDNMLESSSRVEAAGRVVALAQHGADLSAFRDALRRNLMRKSTYNAHTYKFHVAIAENEQWVNPAWRPHVLSASAHWSFIEAMPDAPYYARTKDALKAFKGGA